MFGIQNHQTLAPKKLQTAGYYNETGGIAKGLLLTLVSVSNFALLLEIMSSKPPWHCLLTAGPEVHFQPRKKMAAPALIKLLWLHRY